VQRRRDRHVAQLVECVPNFSEGRRRPVIDALAGAVEQTPGVRLLDVQADESHNRCVISFIGDLDGVSDPAIGAGLSPGSESSPGDGRPRGRCSA